MPEIDSYLEAEIATREMQRAAEALLNHRERRAAETEAEQHRRQLLQQWAGAGFGGAPLPESPEDWAAIPEMVRARIATDAPAVARQFVSPRPLPAETELRRLAGTLVPAVDGPVLEEAGWLEESAQLRQQVLQQKLQQFEQGQVAAATAAAEQAARWEEQRLQGERQANAVARSNWLYSVQSGQPNPLVAVAQQLGAIAPGVRH